VYLRNTYYYINKTELYKLYKLYKSYKYLLKLKINNIIILYYITIMDTDLKFNNCDKNKIIEDIKYLKKKDYIWILKNIIDNDIPFTENKNGCFIKMTSINDDILYKIKLYIELKLEKYNDIQIKLPETINSNSLVNNNLSNYEKSILKKSDYLINQKIIKKENLYYVKSKYI
jgi:hypothetical protein